MIVFVENGLGLWDLCQHQIMSLIQDSCPVLLNMSWIVWKEERTDLIFLIKRCLVGSHANFAKLNQCAIWDYPSASHARLFEMFLSALYGSYSKGRSRCPLPMCSQFVTTPLVHYLIKIDFSDVSFFIPLSQWQSLLSLNVDTGEKIQKLDPGPEIG